MIRRCQAFPSFPIPEQFSSMAHRPHYWSDILLWGTVLMIIVGVLGQMWRLNRIETEERLVRIPFHDANEIGPGAVVRMMGVDVGFVDHIQLKSDHVDVYLNMHQDAPPIPDGSRITILFTGLAGGKSIEIDPPKWPVPHSSLAQKKRWYTLEPIRLKHALQYQNEIAYALQQGADNFATFFGQKGRSVPELQQNILLSNSATNRAVGQINQVHSSMEIARGDIHNTFAGVNNALTQFRQVSGKTIEYLDPTYTGTALYSSARYIHLLSGEGARFLDTFSTERPFAQWVSAEQTAIRRLDLWSMRVQQGGQYHNNIESFEAQIREISTGMTHGVHWTQQHWPQLHQQIRSFLEETNRGLETINDEL